jgi:hypothetical protein
MLGNETTQNKQNLHTMSFLLGLFTGIASMIALGIWLNEREKKRRGKKAVGIYINGKLVACSNPAPFEEERTAGIPFHFTGLLDPDLPTSLEDQLKSAIERDDFEEAARIRDLIKKQ